MTNNSSWSWCTPHTPSPSKFVFIYFGGLVRCLPLLVGLATVTGISNTSKTSGRTNSVTWARPSDVAVETSTPVVVDYRRRRRGFAVSGIEGAAKSDRGSLGCACVSHSSLRGFWTCHLQSHRSSPQTSLTNSTKLSHPGSSVDSPTCPFQHGGLVDVGGYRVVWKSFLSIWFP